MTVLSHPYQLPSYLLVGERVVLRPPLLSDYDEWVRVRGANKEFLQPFEGEWADDCLTEDFFKRRLRWQVQEWKKEQKNFFLIFKKVGEGAEAGAGELLGGMNINDIVRGIGQYASLGYWISEEYQGQGYMSEAIKLILEYCFTTARLHRVQAACLLDNQRSLNLLLRNGFKQEGMAEKYLQVSGEWQDHLLFGLPIERWQRG